MKLKLILLLILFVGCINLAPAQTAKETLSWLNDTKRILTGETKHTISNLQLGIYFTKVQSAMEIKWTEG